METLLLVGVILLIVLNLLFISVLIIAFKFLKDLRLLLVELHNEADKMKVDIANMRSRLTNKGSWVALGLGLLGKRAALGRIAEAFAKSRV